MFEFGALTKRDWALVAIVVIVAALAFGFGLHWMLVHYVYTN
jgi:hypothetical protein